jgi:8-oxo-dGTP pyrophosphatase MutT (NUDIX family)
VEFHTVQTESGKLVNDWIWLDIQDQVNILVRTAQDKFLVFRQSKYGLEGISYAVVGGLIEPGELPEQAAKRELLEELGMESKEWKFLGRFRTDVNRGGGYCSCFIAMNARRSNIHRISDDLEQQSPIELTRDELRELVLSGKFEEAKWSVTASLGLLYLESSPSK